VKRKSCGEERRGEKRRMEGDREKRRPTMRGEGGYMAEN